MFIFWLSVIPVPTVLPPLVHNFNCIDLVGRAPAIRRHALFTYGRLRNVVEILTNLASRVRPSEDRGMAVEDREGSKKVACSCEAC